MLYKATHLRPSLGITWNPELIWNKSVPLFESVSKSGTLLSYNTLILLMFTFVLVPGGGFEPPTRGFSIRCSTPELPGQAKQGSGVLAALFALVQCRNRFFADQL